MTVRCYLSTHRADDAHRDRVAECLGAAQGNHQLPLLQVVSRVEGKGGQTSNVHLDHREVGVPEFSNQVGRNSSEASFSCTGPLKGALFQSYSKAARTAHHVCTGDDVAHGVQNDARTDGMLCLRVIAAGGVVTVLAV